MSQRTRGMVLGAIAFAGITTLGVANIVSERQVDSEVDRIRRAVATERADVSGMLAFRFNGAPNPIALVLDVDGPDVVVHGVTPNLCADVTVRRLIATEHVFVAVDGDGRMRPVSSCAAAD